MVQAQLLNYQGIARNANGVALSFQNISIRLSIRDGSPNGTTLYSETREVRTNQFGLITLVIGSPGAVSSFGNISTINWAASSKFLQVEIDPQGGNNFLMAGTSQLQSVPYAFFANAAYPVGNAGGDLIGSTYPNPVVAPLAITNGKLAADAVTNEKIKDATIENSKLVNSSIGLNGLPMSLGGGQSFAVGTTGTNVNIVSSGTVHSFNFPNASAANRGVLTSADWSSFNSKLSASDTAAMLNKYLRATDTSFMMSRYLRKTDTATMLNGYLRQNMALLLKDTSAAFSVRPLNNRFLDTAKALQSRIQTKLNITDTTTMLTGYQRKEMALLLKDTSAAFSVRPLNNRFLDTATALQSRIQTKLNITDTTTMLNGYQRKDMALLLKDTSAAFSVRPLNNRFLDTATALQSRIQTKLNITDTTTMLNGYLRKDMALLLQDTSSTFAARPLNNRFLDTATALQSRIQTKLNITDTTTMLNGYLRKDMALLLQDTSSTFAARPLNNRFLDTATALQSRIQTKLNIADTTTMLANRLMISDTATMLSTKWSTTGNTLPTVGATYFLGSSNDQPLRFKVNGTWAGELNYRVTNTSYGVGAGQSNTTSANNTAFGFGAMNLTTSSGSDNTAIGQAALQLNISGDNNTAIGQNALNANTGSNNTALGQAALRLNTNTDNNTAVGRAALENTTGTGNTGVGYLALQTNTSGNNNTAIGNGADVGSATGISNSTAIGNGAIVTASNTIQLGNAAISNVQTTGAINAKGAILGFVDVTSAYTITGNDYYVKISSNVTVTLPTAVGRAGQRYVIFNATGALFGLIATTSGQTITGASWSSMSGNIVVNGSLAFFSDGANWLVE